MRRVGVGFGGGREWAADDEANGVLVEGKICEGS